MAIRDAQGKRKPSRVVWARVNDVWPVIRDMRALLTWINQNATEQYRPINPNGFLFARPSDGLFPHFADVFPKVLDDLRVRTDPVTGVRRRLYSCRHYYATQSLLHGVSPYDLSKNMGEFGTYDPNALRPRTDRPAQWYPDWLRSGGWDMVAAKRQPGAGTRPDC